MNEKLKNWLGAAIILALLVISYSAWSYVRYFGESGMGASFRTFSVTGEGKVVAKPDIIQFSFSIIDEGGQDLTALQTQNDTKTKKITDFVKAQGVDVKDIQSTGYSVSPRYQNSSCGFFGAPSVGTGVVAQPVRICPPPAIVGYTITSSYSVKVRDFTKANDILAGVVTAGANNVSQLSFQIDDPAKLRDQARALAVTQARARASALAKSGGFSVGRLVSVDDQSQPMYAYGVGGAADMKVSNAVIAPTAPSIEPGSQKVDVNVTLRYEIN
jgi:uncharacterized protein YggE